MNERRIAGIQETLDGFAEKIDEHYELAEFDNSVDEDELNRKYINCLKVLHARYSAVLHLLKKGIEPKPLEPIE